MGLCLILGKWGLLGLPWKARDRGVRANHLLLLKNPVPALSSTPQASHLPQSSKPNLYTYYKGNQVISLLLNPTICEEKFTRTAALIVPVLPGGPQGLKAETCLWGWRGWKHSANEEAELGDEHIPPKGTGGKGLC